MRVAGRGVATSVLAAAALFLLSGSARAHDAEPQGDRVTEWQRPSADAVQQECVWGWTVSPWHRDDETDESSRAYAVAVAEGMQIEAYGWAHGYSTYSGSAAASSSGQIDVFAVTVVAPQIRCDWKPKVRLRAQVTIVPGWAGVGAYMKGDTSQLDIHFQHGRCAVARSSSRYTTAKLGAKWLGVEFPVEYVTGTAPVDRTVIDYLFDVKSTSFDTATFHGKVELTVFADGHWWNRPPCVEAWVWDSMPGIDYFARCLHCGSELVVLYCWYM